MSQKIAKRIRRSIRAEFPQTTETTEQYRKDVRQLSKGNKNQLKNIFINAPVKTKTSKRQLRRGGKKGFPIDTEVKLVRFTERRNMFDKRLNRWLFHYKHTTNVIAKAL